MQIEGTVHQGVVVLEESQLLPEGTKVTVIVDRASTLGERQTHRAKVCPECGGPLCRCSETRTRYTEDIPDIKPIVTEHTIHREWCPRCEKKVEPTVTAAMPGNTLGNRLLVLAAWLNYALGNTLGQIGDVLNFHLQMPISNGNRSADGADVQAVLMSIFFTLKKRGHSPIQTIATALTTYLKTKKTPPTPCQDHVRQLTCYPSYRDSNHARTTAKKTGAGEARRAAPCRELAGANAAAVRRIALPLEFFVSRRSIASR